MVAPTSKRPRPMRTDLIDVLGERERERKREKKEYKFADTPKKRRRG